MAVRDASHYRPPTGPRPPPGRRMVVTVPPFSLVLYWAGVTLSSGGLGKSGIPAQGRADGLSGNRLARRPRRTALPYPGGGRGPVGKVPVAMRDASHYRPPTGPRPPPGRRVVVTVPPFSAGLACCQGDYFIGRSGRSGTPAQVRVTGYRGAALQGGPGGLPVRTPAEAGARSGRSRWRCATPVIIVPRLGPGLRRGGVWS